MQELDNLLVEKSRPSRINGYVFPSDSVKEQVMKWVKTKQIPNILLSGPPGCGKSTLSRILVNELDVDPCDVKYINASLSSGIGFIREELEPWMRKASFGKIKIVQLEEMDRLTMDAQKALRAVIEDYSSHVRFIGTANYPKQVIDALHSRFQHIEINSLPEDDVVNLVLDVLETNGIICDSEEVLMSHIEPNIPDLRKILNSVDKFTNSEGVLLIADTHASGADIDQWEQIWTSEGDLNIEKALELTGFIDRNNFDWFYQVMYENSHKLPDRVKGVVLLSDYLVRAQTSANQRLHIDAFLYHAFLMDE